MRYLTAGRTVEATVDPATRSMRQADAAMQVPPPVKACLEGGLVNAEPARIGS